MGSYFPHLRVAAAMVSRLTLLSLFAILPSIYSGGYYRSKPAKSVLETLVGDPRFSTLVTAVTTAFPDPGLCWTVWPPSLHSPPLTRSLLQSLQTLLVPFLQTQRGSRLFSSGTLFPRRGCTLGTAPSLYLRPMGGVSFCRVSRSHRQREQLMLYQQISRPKME